MLKQLGLNGLNILFDSQISDLRSEDVFPAVAHIPVFDKLQLISYHKCEDEKGNGDRELDQDQSVAQRLSFRTPRKRAAQDRNRFETGNAYDVDLVDYH